MIAASAWAVAAQHTGTFLFGVFVGLLAASRYRIVRVGNGHTTNGGKAP